MKKFKTNKAIYLLFILMVITSATYSQRIVKVGAFNFYPGIFMDTDGEVKGFYVDALTDLGRRENIKFQYIYGSWNDGLNRMQNGDLDMLTSVAFTEERAKYMKYTSTPLVTVWGEVYVKQSSEVNGILELDHKIIAIMQSDMNGKNLQELTSKLNIPCTYIEVSDFEKVFEYIDSGQADAGVVNNTFGAPKAHEYNLRSSGIIFNPFDIFFTVSNTGNDDLLKLLNNYLHQWQHDGNSVLNVARQKWSHGKVGSITIVPKWFKKLATTFIIVVVILILFIFLLRYQVNKATYKVKQSEALFKSFMENTPAFVYIKDEKLNHIYRNKLVNSLVPSALKNKPSSAKTIFEPEIANFLEDTDRQILSKEKLQADIQYPCTINGQKIWMHDYKFALQMPNEKLTIGGISFNITQLKETESELIQAKEKAEESDRIKTAFLQNMSHEIRTPMNSIMGFASLLPDEEDKKTIINYSDIIYKNAELLVHVIDDIVLYSQLQNKQFTSNSKEFDATNLINDIKHSFNLPEYKKGVELITETNTNESIIISSDYEKLRQVFTNLISNSFKYTSSGTITFGLTMQENEPIFFVKDTGIGIPKLESEKVFERFYRASNVNKSAISGTGLGLSIVKELIELLGGKIWVESDPDGISGEKGSTFYFTVPLSHSNA